MDEFKYSLSFLMANQFLQSLSGQINSIEVFQVYPDSDKLNLRPRIIIGTLEQHFNELSQLNREGYAISVVINRTNLKGRSNENVLEVRALFTDDDDGKNIQLQQTPSFKVYSKRGCHNYYLIKDLQLNDFKEFQKSLSQAAQTDNKIVDLARVMRLPGFFHMKDPDRSFFVKYEPGSNKVYSKSDFQYLTKSLSQNNIPQPFEKSNQQISNFKKYIGTLKEEEGYRNHSTMLLCRQGLALNVSEEEIKEEVLSFCKRSNLDANEGLKVLENQIRYHKILDFKVVEKNAENENLELAKLIINNHRCILSGEVTLLTIDGTLYKFKEFKYQPIDEMHFQLEIRNILNSIPNIKVTKYKVLEILENIKSETMVKSPVKNNSFVQSQPLKTEIFSTPVSKDRYIAMSGGVLNLTDAMKGDTTAILHTPKFFSTSVLPYRYMPQADCPIFKSILERILPDPNDQKMLQYWFGYHLLETVSFGKFMIFLGSGANGKSVILKVLRLFLGAENVSAVPIESFNNKRTFSMAETHGKFANIYDEMSSSEIDESTIKNYVTGGQVQVERKYMHPITFTPTAKLTFSSNIMPVIKDRSDGFWRRVLLLEFKEKIALSEQNANFLEDSFWILNNELPGVFNWALEGAKEILKVNKLYESENSIKSVQETKIEADSARLWIHENLTFSSGSFVNRTEVYNFYKNHQYDQALKPCTQKEFYLEIEKAFPQAVSQSNPIANQFGKRVRGWHNLKCTAGTDY